MYLYLLSVGLFQLNYSRGRAGPLGSMWSEREERGGGEARLFGIFIRLSKKWRETGQRNVFPCKRRQRSKWGEHLYRQICTDTACQKAVNSWSWYVWCRVYEKNKIRACSSWSVSFCKITFFLQSSLHMRENKLFFIVEFFVEYSLRMYGRCHKRVCHNCSVFLIYS